MSAQHTPLPWKEWRGDIVADGDAASDYDDYVIAGIGVSRGGRSSAYCPVKAHKPAGLANAAFIVRACNSHYELLEALEALAKFHISGGHEGNADEAISMATAAIAKARGEA